MNANKLTASQLEKKTKSNPGALLLPAGPTSYLGYLQQGKAGGGTGGTNREAGGEGGGVGGEIGGA